MTGEEAKKALYNRLPIVWRECEYQRITAIIYRLDDRNNLIVSAEMRDQNNNSLTVARIEEIKIKGGTK